MAGAAVQSCPVWDPGARILIHGDPAQATTTHTLRYDGCTSLHSLHPTARRPRVHTRVSPHKSQDSGFSDSGESEGGASSQTSTESRGHVTKVL